MASRLYLRIIATAVSLLGGFLLQQGVAKADASSIYPKTPADATYYCRPSVACPGAATNSPLYLTVGSGEFSNNVSLTKVYSVGQTYTVDVIEATICGSTQNDGYQAVQSIDIVNTGFSMNIFFFNRDRTQIMSSDNIGSNCASRNRTYTITLPASSYNPLTSRYEGYIRADMVNPSGATNENSFRYQFSGAEAGVGFDAAQGFTALTVSNRNIPVNNVHDLSAEFAPGCAAPQTGNGLISVYDVDRGLYQGTGSYPELVWIGYSRTRGQSGGGGWVPFGFGTFTGGNAGIDSLPFTYNKDFEYRLEVRGLSRPNAFAVQVSGVDLEDYPSSYTCTIPNTPPSINFGLTCNAGGTVSFTFVNVSDAEGGTINVSGSGFSGSRNGSGAVAMSPATIAGIRDNNPHNITLTPSDTGPGAAQTGSSVTRSYTCALPPPTVTCTGLNSSSLIEPGEPYSPNMSVTNGGPALAPDINVSITFSIDGQPGLGTRVASGLVARTATRSFGVGVVAPGYATSNPAPFALPSANRYTARAVISWSSVSGGYSGSCPLTPDVAGVSSPNRTIYADVAIKPYFRVLGGDIWSTGGGSSSVEGNNKQLNTYITGTPDASARSGSGAQGLIVGSAVINGVSSGVMLASPSVSIKPLTLANTGIAPASSTYGGGFGSLTYVVPTPKAGLGAWTTGTTVAANTTTAYTHTGNATYSNGAVPVGARMTVYITGGNLTINGNIIYSNSGAFTSLTSIPHIKFVVRRSGLVGGNIYINSNVSQIDAELIAEGTIDTCNAGGNKYASCSSLPAQRLLVNGSLTASRISLDRMYGTVRSSTQDDGKTSGCSAAAPLASGYCNYVNIAEIIQFTPEVYLSEPAEDPGTPPGNQYDSITSLPPLF